MNDKKKTILVADDDIDILEQTRAHLEGAGYTVVAFETEKEAKTYLKTEKPDMAVFDLMMENQDSGFILSHKVKRVDEKIPVILVTAVTSQTGIHFDASTREERTWIKADAFIEKPIRYEQLLVEIKRLFEE
ncbi:MAG: response regulator [bacterium]|nr:response regulator [bacterium]